MKATIGAAATLAALVLGDAGTVQAQNYTNYRFCAVYDFYTRSCGFDTFAQCLATVSGRGGFCEQNYNYQPPAQPRRKKARRSKAQ